VIACRPTAGAGEPLACSYEKQTELFQKESCKFYEAQRASSVVDMAARAGPEPSKRGVWSPYGRNYIRDYNISAAVSVSLSHTQKSLDLLKITALLCWRDSPLFHSPGLSIFTVVGVCLKAREEIVVKYISGSENNFGPGAPQCKLSEVCISPRDINVFSRHV